MMWKEDIVVYGGTGENHEEPHPGKPELFQPRLEPIIS
jgi:hypothetical protein